MLYLLLKCAVESRGEGFVRALPINVQIEVVPHTDTSDLANQCQVGMKGGCQERRDSKHKLHYRDEIQL